MQEAWTFARNIPASDRRPHARISGFILFFDDILISGNTEEEHLKALDEVLSRLEKARLRVKQKKCKIIRTLVKYLGYRIDAAGPHTLQDKVEAIQDALIPSRSPNLNLILDFFHTMANSCLTCHLHYIHSTSCWGEQHEKYFNKYKRLLISAKFVAHYNSSLKLTLTCDASSCGFGVVLAHNIPDGSECLIGYASRTE